MAEAKRSAAGPRNVSRSVTISASDVTVDDIVAGATDVGAPTTAQVSTGSNYNPSPDGTNEYPHSITYTWSDTL